MAILDKDLNLLECSRPMVEDFCVTGTITKGVNIGKILKDIPEQFFKDLRQSLQGDKIERSEYRHYPKNNQSQWLKWSAGPWTYENGSLASLMVILEDITQHKRKEQLHINAEQVSRTGSWELDLMSNELYWSPMTKIIHEVGTDYLPVLSEGLSFYKDGAHREKISLAINRAISKGIPYDEELILVSQRGNELWVRAKGKAEMLNGRCIRIYGTIQDIDKEKKAEIQHTQTSDRLKLATEAAQIGIWELHLSENKVICNANMYTIFGIQKNTFTTPLDWLQSVYEEDVEKVKEAFAKTMKEHSPLSIQFRVVKPNGKIAHIISYGIAQEDVEGNVVKVLSSNWDITELKLTKLKLEKSKESFAETFQNSAVGMAMVDQHGNWLKVNASICKSLGYTEEELLQRTFQEITHPEDLKNDIKYFHDTIKGKRDSYQIEKRYYHKNGSLVYAILTVTAVRNLRGDLSYFISQVLDITPIKEAEKKLNSLVAVTKAQNESLINFAHIVSHNLRSHSTNMSMLTKFLMEEEDERERANLLKMLANASDTLSETIHHLNEVVQVNAGAVQPLERVNVKAIIQSTEKSIEMMLQEKNARTQVDVPSTHYAKGVPAYMESVFLNLYTNSLKYCSPDRSPVITISTKETLDKLLITFKDNGIGIDLERHGNKIFGMYKTFHNNQDAKGIGLFITKNQIEAMKGSITVESEIDAGTTFKITLLKS